MSAGKMLVVDRGFGIRHVGLRRYAERIEACRAVDGDVEVAVVLRVQQRAEIADRHRAISVVDAERGWEALAGGIPATEPGVAVIVFGDAKVEVVSDRLAPNFESGVV